MAAIALVLPFGCTQPNPAFDLEKRADTETLEDPDGDGDSGTTQASESTRGADDDTAGEDHDETESADGSTDDTSSDTSSATTCEFDDCEPHEYCSFPLGTACGLDEPQLGVCKPRPESCPPDRDPVLACDCSTWYDNPCLARMDGIDIVCRDNEDGCVCF